MTQNLSLVEVTPKNREAVLSLELAPSQKRYIAPNSKTLRQAEEAPEAWLRAIFVDRQVVGLLLLHDEHLREEPREIGYYFLWRIMIDSQHQGKGYGREAVNQVVEYISNRPHAKRLLSSFIPGEEGPEGFYKSYGFTPTGNKTGEDIEIEFPLTNQ